MLAFFSLDVVTQATKQTPPAHADGVCFFCAPCLAQARHVLDQYKLTSDLLT